MYVDTFITTGKDDDSVVYKGRVGIVKGVLIGDTAYAKRDIATLNVLVNVDGVPTAIDRDKDPEGWLRRYATMHPRFGTKKFVEDGDFFDGLDDSAELRSVSESLARKAFNPDQPRDEIGRFASMGASGMGAEGQGMDPRNSRRADDPEPKNPFGEEEKREWKQPVDSKGRPIPIRVRTVDDAIPLILEGKVIEVDDVAKVNTIVDKLGQMVEEAKSLGKEAPNYDLCQVSVPGTNLFCAKSLGIKRIDMPQFKTQPRPGSEASTWESDKNGEVDGSKQFLEHLRGQKVKITEDKMPAAFLKASQREMVGAKVSGMMRNKSYDPAKEPIFVSRDNYVIDGHHRWAAVVGRDAADGKLGNEDAAMMKIIKIDMPISEVLIVSRDWTKKVGLEGKAGVKKAWLFGQCECTACAESIAQKAIEELELEVGWLTKKK